MEFRLIIFAIYLQLIIVFETSAQNSAFSENQQTKGKSEIMCEEYGRQIKDIIAQPSIRSNANITTGNSTQKIITLIVGGKPSGPDKFHHMAALGEVTPDGNFIVKCGGSLISPEWILTAAHCLIGSKDVKHVRVGSHNLTDHHGIIRGIQNRIHHPDYKPPALYYDIGLVKLHAAVTFNNRIKPACLYQEFFIIPRILWATGWGTSEFGESETIPDLQMITVDVLSNKMCVNKYNYSQIVPNSITADMICAGDVSGNWSKDTCQGDSGGPLQRIHEKIPYLYEIVGITSFGEGCAFHNTPGVYIKVSHYLNWIEDIVWP